jgi:hypothetical protein
VSKHTTITPRSWKRKSWTHAQLRRLGELRRAERSDPTTTWIGYANRCADGSSAYRHDATPPHAGWIERTNGPIAQCEPGTLHATRAPIRWPGCRVWIVALVGPREDWPDEHKSGAMRREWIGEVLREDADRAGDVPLSARLRADNLSGAYLGGANLCGADLGSANLGSAYLSSADLRGAYLCGADLCGANLRGADLSSADLRGADLRGADLRGADLCGADLCGAYLCGAGRYQADPEIPGWIVIDSLLRRTA